jgi:LPXTG-motif cell wall-anchored protein
MPQASGRRRGPILVRTGSWAENYLLRLYKKIGYGIVIGIIINIFLWVDWRFHSRLYDWLYWIGIIGLVGGGYLWFRKKRKKRGTVRLLR